jgi:hypothetical protein
MKTLAERFPRPDLVKRINLMANTVGGAAELISLEPNAMIEASRRVTGLSDFGERIDGDWRGRLEGLVASLDAEADLNVMGRLQVRQEILRCLQSRLYLTKKITDQPEIVNEGIIEPLIITGTGRSGTSITLELLSQDADALAPIAWKAFHPTDDLGDKETLLRLTECEQDLWMDVCPQMAAIHELRSDIPDECIGVQKPSFGGMLWWVLHDVQTFPMDPEAAMKYQKVVMQLMQYEHRKKHASKNAPHWVLKTPTYLPMLDLVFSMYPDAWIILNHRDPLKTVPSGMSTFAATRYMRSDREGSEQLLELAGNARNDMMMDVYRRREAGELPERFIDLHFSDLMSDPVKALEGVYRQSGKHFSQDYRHAITEYLAQKPKGKHGKHRYLPEDWGMNTETLETQAEAYMQSYQVEKES